MSLHSGARAVFTYAAAGSSAALSACAKADAIFPGAETATDTTLPSRVTMGRAQAPNLLKASTTGAKTGSSASIVSMSMTAALPPVTPSTAVLIASIVSDDCP